MIGTLGLAQLTFKLCYIDTSENTVIAQNKSVSAEFWGGTWDWLKFVKPFQASSHKYRKQESDRWTVSSGWFCGDSFLWVPPTPSSLGCHPLTPCHSSCCKPFPPHLGSLSSHPALPLPVIRLDASSGCFLSKALSTLPSLPSWILQTVFRSGKFPFSNQFPQTSAHRCVCVMRSEPRGSF